MTLKSIYVLIVVLIMFVINVFKWAWNSFLIDIIIHVIIIESLSQHHVFAGC